MREPGGYVVGFAQFGQVDATDKAVVAREAGMKKLLRWIGRGVFALLVLFAVVLIGYRLRGPSAAQREALALLQEDQRPAQGHNAFALLWYLPYDVPLDQVEARTAADVATMRARLASDAATVDYRPDAPRLPELASADLALLCATDAAGCLARVAVEPERVRALLAAQPARLARAAALAERDFYWNEFPPDPRFGFLPDLRWAPRLWLSALALQYVDGDRVGALAGVCRNVDSWRRLRRTNSLVGAMLAMRAGDGALGLFGDMLAGLPADEAVPADCASALRPVAAADVDRCAEMAGEFLLSQTLVREMNEGARARPWWERWQSRLLFEPAQTQAWFAEPAARHCGAAASARMLADRPLGPADEIPPPTHRLECVSSLVGCILADVAAPAYLGYDRRTLDFAAHLRLAAALLWLRDTPAGTSLAERFAQRPPALRSDGHVSGFDAARGVLFVDNLQPRPAARFELAVAGSATGG